MTAESLSLFYEEQRTTSAEPRDPGDGMRRVTRDGTTVVEDWAAVARAARAAAPAPELAPGQLVRWTDEGGCPHVGRVESTTDGIVSVAYGPRPHRETCPAAELTPITDKDGEGRLR
jgi:hypothetical protein